MFLFFKNEKFLNLLFNRQIQCYFLFFQIKNLFIRQFEFTGIFGIEEFGLIWPSVFLGQNLSDSSHRKNNQTHIRASQNNIIS